MSDPTLRGTPYDVVDLGAAADAFGADWSFERFRHASMSPSPPALLPVVADVGPEWYEQSHNAVARVPALGVHRLQEVLVTGPGYLFQGGRLVVDRSHLSQVSKEWLARDFALTREDVRKRPQRRVDGPALMVVAPGHLIYGHWLVDLLPRAAIAHALCGSSFNDLPILLPDDTPVWVESMCNHCFGTRAEQFIRYDHSAEALSCTELMIPTYAHNGHYFFHPFLREFYTQFVDRGAWASANRRFCISRQNFEAVTQGALKRLDNRWELEDLAVRYGFEVLKPEELSFRDQIAIFSTARAVVGEFGSALHNSVFSPPGAVIAAIRMPNSIQSRLGAVCDQLNAYLIPERTWRDERGGETYSASRDKIERLLAEIVDSIE